MTSAGVVLQQSMVHKPHTGWSGLHAVLVRASAAAWIINSFQLHQREDLSHPWTTVCKASPRAPPRHGGGFQLVTPLMQLLKGTRVSELPLRWRVGTALSGHKAASVCQAAQPGHGQGSAIPLPSSVPHSFPRTYNSSNVAAIIREYSKISYFLFKRNNILQISVQNNFCD